MSRPVLTLNVYNGATFDAYAASVIESVVIERGKQTLLDRVKTSTMTVVVHDAVGYLDPSSPAAIGYGPDTFVFLRGVDSGAANRTLFAGRVQTYSVAYPNDELAVITMTCVGSFQKLSQVTFPTATMSVAPSQPVDVLLDAAVAYAIGGGASLGTWVLSSDGSGGTMTGVNATGDTLAACQQVADGADGDFLEEMWDDPAHPVFRFIARRRRFGAVQATFTESSPSPPTTYPYDEASWVSLASSDLIRNTVTVTANGLAAQTATSASSVTAHGTQQVALSTWHDDTAAAMVRAANEVVQAAEQPKVNVTSIRLEPDAQDNTNLWDLVLKLGIESSGCLRLFHRVKVIRVTPFATSTREMVATGFRHTIVGIAQGGWITDLFLVDAEASNGVLILDDATLGKLDTGKLG